MTFFLVPLLVLAPGGMTVADWEEAMSSRSHLDEVEVEVSEPWLSLAQCESHGQWDYGPHSNWGSRIFEGGLQFHPKTWDAFRSESHPEAAYEATPLQQVEVAERVLEAQGWAAWPACSRKLGLRR